MGSNKLTDEEIAKLPYTQQREILGSRERRVKYKDRYSQQRKQKRVAKRLQLCDILGSRVCKCGFSDIRALQFDHINGNGRKYYMEQFQQPSLRDKILNYYIANPDIARKTFQVLCANCNWIKRDERNEIC